MGDDFLARGKRRSADLALGPGAGAGSPPRRGRAAPRGEEWLPIEWPEGRGWRGFHHHASLCIADTEDEQTPRVATASAWGYLRLRRAEYSADDVRDWAAWTRGQAWDDAFVFFKHEDAGTGPRLAKEFAAAFC